MGNDHSAPYEGRTEVLGGRDIASVAKYMKSKDCQRVFVMLGAGVSTAAGIPDFRSPGTGLYSNLQRLNLPYPEAVFEISYFREDPLPFYTLARELYPGRFRPTLTHTFVKLLADHRLLDTCFTQNIDTLERQAGVPADRIVEAHGSFADQHCIDCHRSFDGAKMKAAVESGDVVRCGACGGLVKPDIVFFGESLPPLFQQKVPRLRSADLLVVIGTSLKVHPFASLTGLVPERCPRVLINMEPAGDIGARPDDVVLLGRCDEVVRDLARALGWEEELDREWAKTEVLVPLDSIVRADMVADEKEKESEGGGALGALKDAVAEPEPEDVPAELAPSVRKEEVEDALVEAEVETLAERVGKALEISERAGPGEVQVETISPEPRAQATVEASVPEVTPTEASPSQAKEKEKL